MDSLLIWQSKHYIALRPLVLKDIYINNLLLDLAVTVFSKANSFSFLRPRTGSTLNISIKFSLSPQKLALMRKAVPYKKKTPDQIFHKGNTQQIPKVDSLDLQPSNYIKLNNIKIYPLLSGVSFW